VCLLFEVLNFARKNSQGACISLGFELPQDAVRGLPLEVPHHVRERIIPGKLPDKVQVIGHDNKGVQHESLAKTKAVEGIQEDTLDDITLEQVKIICCLGGDEVEVVRVEVGFPGWHGLFSQIWQHRSAPAQWVQVSVPAIAADLAVRASI
jgi:hypothetical protein